MNLLRKLHENFLPTKLTESQTETSLTVNRIIPEPGTETQRLANTDFMAKILHAGIKDRAQLNFCVLSLVHHLRDKDSIDVSDHKNSEMFFANDPIQYWYAYYPKGYTFHPSNITGLSLITNNNEMCKMRKLLMSYFTHKIFEDGTDFFIPLERIKTLRFSKTK